MTRISPAGKTPKKRAEVRGNAGGSPGRRKRAEPGPGSAPSSDGVPATRPLSARGGLTPRKRSSVPGSFNIEFGKRIRELRARKGLSQEQLSLNAGLGRQLVGDIERGEGNVKLSTLRGLKRALGITIADLMNGIA